jgi:ribosomal protein S12 methylthiotransferase
MTLQAGISLPKNNQQLKHKIFSMLVEGTDPEHNILVGRTYRDAPEIDGLMIAEGTAEVGDIAFGARQRRNAT